MQCQCHYIRALPHFNPRECVHCRCPASSWHPCWRPRSCSPPARHSLNHNQSRPAKAALLPGRYRTACCHRRLHTGTAGLAGKVSGPGVAAVCGGRRGLSRSHARSRAAGVWALCGDTIHIALCKGSEKFGISSCIAVRLKVFADDVLQHAVQSQVASPVDATSFNERGHSCGLRRMADRNGGSRRRPHTASSCMWRTQRHVMMSSLLGCNLVLHARALQMLLLCLDLQTTIRTCKQVSCWCLTLRLCMHLQLQTAEQSPAANTVPTNPTAMPEASPTVQPTVLLMCFARMHHGAHLKTCRRLLQAYCWVLAAALGLQRTQLQPSGLEFLVVCQCATMAAGTG